MRLSVRLAYPAYRVGERAACALPGWLLSWVTGVSATVAMLVAPGRRRMIGRHVQRVNGRTMGRLDLHLSIWRTFRSYAAYWLDTFRLSLVDQAGLERRFQVVGMEHLDRALAEGRGAVLATAHLGSWDLAGAWLAGRGYPLTAVVERLQPPELLEWFSEVRRRNGIDVIVRGPQVWQQLADALGANRVVVLVCDRDLSGRGVEVEFFGERTTLPSGPGALAVRCGAPVLPVAVYATGNRHHLGVARPPLPVERTGDDRRDVAHLTQQLACELEMLIRYAPEQWHLTQPNWPSDQERSASQRSPAANSSSS
jgi:phosphatidylinositol dimannoside acyltransferase